MPENKQTQDLREDQWLILDLLASAKQSGLPYVHRQQILQSTKIPDGAKLRLVMAALTMPNDYVVIRNDHEIHITEQGIAALAMRFGSVKGDVIALPSHYGSDIVLDMPEPGAKPN